MKKKIISIQKKLRLLKKWEISYIKDPKYSGSATIMPSKRKATIYKWEGGPNDYILHEMIHCAIRELLKRMSGKKIAGKIKEAEETLVSDLCSMITNK